MDEVSNGVRSPNITDRASGSVFTSLSQGVVMVHVVFNSDFLCINGHLYASIDAAESFGKLFTYIEPIITD